MTTLQDKVVLHISYICTSLRQQSLRHFREAHSIGSRLHNTPRPAPLFLNINAVEALPKTISKLIMLTDNCRWSSNSHVSSAQTRAQCCLFRSLKPALATRWQLRTPVVNGLHITARNYFQMHSSFNSKQ